jgi:penicillin-binding protein 2
MSAEIRNYLHEQHYFKLRLAFTAVAVVCLFGVLAARFYYLQISQHQHYQTLAENNRISLLPIVPNRGLIYDKNGILLANNFFVYTLEVTPSKVHDLEASIDALSKMIEISPRDRKRFKKLTSESKDFESVPIRTHLNDVEAARFAVNHYRYPGVEIKSRLFRHYPFGMQGAHMVGYIGRINDKDLKNIEKNDELSNYKGSDHIGKSGLEQFYEKNLHGVTGFQQIEIDADGRPIRTLSSQAPIAGDNITLSVDIKLQEIAEQAFGAQRGALVAINPKTGEVLSYVSQPSFDPNLFVGGIDVDNWKLLNESIDKPLVNRPVRGLYPAASTIKPFIAMAGLEAGLRAPPYTIRDDGYFMLPGSSHRYRDWKKNGHGLVDIQRAITISCDTFFYGLAVELGIKRLTDFVGHFGFGKKTGIDITGENAGLLPTPEWKKRRFKQSWYTGETVIVGIGQGYTLITPMQLAHATATLANNGTSIKPHFVAKIHKSGSGQMEVIKPVVQDQVFLNPDNVEIVKNGMINVTLPGGTAASVGYYAPYQIAAKTGTAQVVGIKQNEKYDAKAISERNRDHALFIAYAPADDPKIALAVVVENGEHGGSAAGPIARKVMDYYLLGKKPPEEPASTLPKPFIASGTAGSVTPPVSNNNGRADAQTQSTLIEKKEPLDE